jgi:hypothetical protein
LNFGELITEVLFGMDLQEQIVSKQFSLLFFQEFLQLNFVEVESLWGEV